MKAVRVATLLSVLGAGSAFGANASPCELLTRPQVASVVGDGAIGMPPFREELPQRRKAKPLAPMQMCVWSVKERQSAVELRVAAAPLDGPAMDFVLDTLSEHGKRRQEDEQDFGSVSCWAEARPKPQFPYAACVGNVRGNALKVQFSSNTASPTILQAKLLFDQAAAGL